MRTAAPGVYCADLNHTHLRVGILEFYPFIILERQEDGASRYTGFSIDLLNIVATACNFTYSLVLPRDGEWGDNRDGQWTGLIGQLYRKEIDLTVPPLSITEERSVAVDFTVPYYYASSKIAVRKEFSHGTWWGVFLRPFHWQVYLMLLTVSVISLALFSCFKTSGNKPPPNGPSLSVVDTIELIFGSAVREAMPLQWTNRPRCVLFAAWCLMSLALTSCYTSKLTSLFVETTISPPFESVSDMLKRGDFRWGVLGGTRMLTYLRLARDPDTRAMYNGLTTFAKDDPEVLSLDPEVHLAKVLQGHYAFIVDSVTVTLWESEHCQVLGLLENVLGESLWAFHTQKNSSLTASLSLTLLRLHDAGVMTYLRDKWFPSRAGCQDNRTSPPSITMATLQGPFYVTLASVAVAASVLLAERNIHWKRNRHILTGPRFHT